MPYQLTDGTHISPDRPFKAPMTMLRPTFDGNGEPILDENDDPVMESYVDPAVQFPPPRIMSAEERTRVGLTWVDPPPTPAPVITEEKKRRWVNAEWARRLDGGFTVDFGSPTGVRAFQSHADARENIAGALSLSGLAVVAGAQVGDLRWANPDVDFEWIAADNSRVKMDAQTCMAFCQAAIAYKSALTFAGRTLKDLETIPEDVTDDQYWPSSSLSLV